MQLVTLIYEAGSVRLPTKAETAGAAKGKPVKGDIVFTVDRNMAADNAAFAKFAEALKHFTSQNQWPPVYAEE
jgi:hypothetical protein